MINRLNIGLQLCLTVQLCRAGKPIGQPRLPVAQVRMRHVYSSLLLFSPSSSASSFLASPSTRKGCLITINNPIEAQAFIIFGNALFCRREGSEENGKTETTWTIFCLAAQTAGGPG